MNFYIKKKTKIHGPFSDKQIRGGIKSGKLKSDSLISDSSSGPWSTIAEALKTNPQYEALARPKAKTGKSSAPKSPSLPKTEATLLPDLEIPVLTDDTPPIAAAPEPPKAPVNSYWGQQNTPEQTAGQAVNSPQSTSGNSHQARLQSAKTKKTLLIVFGSIACVGTLLVGTVLLLILLPFLGHQSEIKQCRDKAKEMARHMARYNEELSKEEPNKLLLSNYEDRVYTLSQEIGEIQDNWSDGEREQFTAWVQSEGVGYAQGFALSRNRLKPPGGSGSSKSSLANRTSSSPSNSKTSPASQKQEDIIPSVANKRAWDLVLKSALDCKLRESNKTDFLKSGARTLGATLSEKYKDSQCENIYAKILKQNQFGSIEEEIEVTIEVVVFKTEEFAKQEMNLKRKAAFADPSSTFHCKELPVPSIGNESFCSKWKSFAPDVIVRKGNVVFTTSCTQDYPQRNRTLNSDITLNNSIKVALLQAAQID